MSQMSRGGRLPGRGYLQAYLNGMLFLEHRDTRYGSGQVGLWTKTDSITAFDDFVVRGVHAGG